MVRLRCTWRASYVVWRTWIQERGCDLRRRLPSSHHPVSWLNFAPYLQRIRGFTMIRYIHRLFTYLLTYLLTCLLMNTPTYLYMIREISLTTVKSTMSSCALIFGNIFRLLTRKNINSIIIIELIFFRVSRRNILPKINAYKQYYVRKQELAYPSSAIIAATY